MEAMVHMCFVKREAQDYHRFPGPPTLKPLRSHNNPDLGPIHPLHRWPTKACLIFQKAGETLLHLWNSVTVDWLKAISITLSSQALAHD